MTQVEESATRASVGVEIAMPEKVRPAYMRGFLLFSFRRISISPKWSVGLSFFPHGVDA